MTKNVSFVFSFAVNKHLCLHKEQVPLEGGGHIAPQRIYNS